MEGHEQSIREETLKAIVEMAYNMLDEEHKKQFEQNLVDLERKVRENALKRNKEKGYIN